MLTCKQATHLVSERLDRKLSRRERFALRLHVWLCNNCRRFERQINYIRQAVKRGGREGHIPTDKSLAPDSMDRIRKALQQHSTHTDEH